MRIGFVVWSLCTVKGGIERLGVSLSNAMHARGHEVVLFYHAEDTKHGTRPLYPVDPAVRVAPFTLRDAASMERARQTIIRSDLDVLCAMFSWDALLWFPHLLHNTGIPLLISEHNHPGIIERERWNRYEHLACMAGADAVHLLADSFRDFYPEFLRQRITVIANPAQPAREVDWSRENASRKRLLAAGRLVDGHKQFSLLIQAFALLAGALPDWDLHICGEGHDRPLYEDLIVRHGLASRIFLAGRVDDMDAAYAAGHLFCIPSRYEGFGLVTVEAQRHALPVVGFAGCSGTNEIVVHGENGVLAEEMTPQGLAAALRPLMKSASLRRRMGERGREMLTRYSPDVIYGQWEKLLLQTSTVKGNTRLRLPALSEEEAVHIALREVLARPWPLDRPACEGVMRDMHEHRRALGQAYALLRQHGVVPQ